MAKVTLSRVALYDYQRQIDHLLIYGNEQSPEKFSNAIRTAIHQLSDNPQISRPYYLDKRYRELVIPVTSSSTYLLLFEYDEIDDSVMIIAIKNVKEESYTGY